MWGIVVFIAGNPQKRLIGNRSQRCNHCCYCYYYLIHDLNAVFFSTFVLGFYVVVYFYISCACYVYGFGMHFMLFSNAFY